MTIALLATFLWCPAGHGLTGDPQGHAVPGTIGPSAAPRTAIGGGAGNVFHQAPDWVHIRATALDLAGQPGLALAGAGPLEVVRVSTTPRITYVHLRQVPDGRPILGSHIVLQLDPANRPVLLRGMTVPEAESILPEPGLSLPGGLLRTASLGGLGLDAGEVEWEEDSAAWMAWKDDGGGTRLRPVRHLRFRSEDPAGWWEAAVDERTAEVLVRESRLSPGRLEGSADGMVEPSTVGDTMERLPFRGMTVLATAPGTETAAVTDTLGAFSLDLPSPGEYRLSLLMRGPFAWIQDAGRSLWTPTDTLRVTAPGRVEFLWDDTNSHPSHRNAFHHVNRAHAHIRALDPDSALAPLDQPVRIRVEDPSGYCNAYWNGRLLNFYAAGSGCASSARIADVVYHEYGHAVTQYCYAPFFAPHDMNEAFSDYFAATMTDQPYIGVGFFGPRTYIRELETVRVWPRDRSPSPHIQGLILAGALWNLRKELGHARTDSLFHFARYGAAQSFDDYMLDILTWDDNDGNLDNGTPNFRAITHAFRRHGIGDYSVRIEHEPLPDIEVPGPVVEARAWIRSLFPLSPDSVALFYSVGDAFERLPAFPLAGTREHHVFIPAAPPGSGASGYAISYYWAAVDTAGHRATLPASAPDSLFSFLIGPDEVAPVIEHDQEASITADRRSLPLRAAVTDNSGRVGPVRARMQPESGGGVIECVLQPMAEDGMFRGELELPDLTPGSALLYHLLAEDRAITPNQTRLPQHPLEYRVLVHEGTTLTLEEDPGPLIPAGDWAWGSPALPVEAWSGERVWGTNLNGPYASNTSASLVWGPIDLSGFDRALLEIRHLYRFEAGYDGGRVEYSAGSDGPWFPLEPEESYAVRWLRTFEGPAFTGASGGWRPGRFPLDRLLDGAGHYIRFRLESDEYVEDLGWYLDDIALVKAQARSLPRDLRILECGPRCLELTWQAPLDVDTLSSRFLGYNLYRAEGDGPFTPDPIHPRPLRRLRHRDSTVITDLPYRYRLTALYDEGESRPREVSGAAYAPTLVIETDEVRYHMNGVTASDTTLMIMNGTGGTLFFNTYVGESGSSPDELRVNWDPSRSPDGDYELLITDALDAPDMPDLASLEARNRNDAELGLLLELRIRTHSPWADPLQTWGALVWLDTDDNLATGRADYNLGAEFLVALGKLAEEAGHDGPAVLLDSRMRPVIGLMGVDFRPGSDSLTLPIPWNLLGDPDDVRILVTLASSLSTPPFDRMPDLPGLPWLDRQPRHGRARPGHPQPFSLRFDADKVGMGQYEAVLFIESNDAGNPVREIPVHLNVSGLLPQDVQDLRFAAGPEGMAISFSLPSDPAVIGIGVERAESARPVWQRIPPEPLLPDSVGVYRLLDESVESSVEYLYRFRTVFEGGRVVVYGPHTALYDYRPAILRLRSVGPNPFSESVSMRLDLPDPADVRVEIFDATGRRLRDDLGGGFAPGVLRIDWDGRDATGRRAPSGVYWARISAGSWRNTIRLVLVR